MNWRRLLGLPRRKPENETDPMLEHAQQRVDELRERGEQVAQSLEGRLRRNHWSETVARIARGERL